MKHLAVGWMLAVPLFLVVTPASAAAESQPRRAGYTRNVAIVLYEGVELLDFAGPGEVFAAAAHQSMQGDAHAFRVYTVAKSRAPLTSQGFVKVTPDFTPEDAPVPDVLVIPGGDTGVVLEDAAYSKWLAKTAAGAEVALTVCTGALVLGKAGMLDGLDVTTFNNAIDSLQRMAPKARVHRGRRFIDNGRIVTTAGVSAGIDGSLHVVARLLGLRVAEQTARYMEYRWTPEPHLVGGYTLLNPSLDDRGRAHQQAEILGAEKNWAAAAKAYRELAASNASDATAWYRLGQVLLASKDYDGAIEASLRAASAKSYQVNALYNAACGYSLKADAGRALEYLGKAIDAGLEGSWALSDPHLEHARKDPRFQKLAARLR
ncbi:DJ-1/PfpI family protein [Archangium violaceum]|uniref:DJ-1/PfpI family protein n=1 Tax=Archangium violaceum TaxID=83451 RepID=UPI00193B1C6A|nr:DJ-1/PfpI family protein [Archangium violaceum]QRK12386.1 DJ-1/PfpI family protein [Archangium violaceum]